MNIFDLPVHPHADIFPMLSESELAELANDIAENGLREPLVLQQIDGVVTLIDGRNRRAACALVHIDPEVRYLNGEDPTAFIFSTNIARRHLTAGQKAMAHALMYPETQQGKRTDLETEPRNPVSKLPCSDQYLNRARAVLKYPDLVAMVMAGKSLNDAYATAKAKEQDADAYGEAVAFLEKNAPDLAVLVREENKSPFDMRRQYEEALRKRKTDRMGLWLVLEKVSDYLAVLTDDQFGTFDEYFDEAPEECKVDLNKMARSMASLSKYLKTKAAQ